MIKFLVPRLALGVLVNTTIIYVDNVGSSISGCGETMLRYQVFNRIAYAYVNVVFRSFYETETGETTDRDRAKEFVEGNIRFAKYRHETKYEAAGKEFDDINDAKEAALNDIFLKYFVAQPSRTHKRHQRGVV